MMGDEELSLLDRFVVWFEEKGIGGQFDSFIEQHAKGFLGANAEETQDLSRTELYKQYEQLFDGLLAEFLKSAGVDQATFLKEADKAEGMQECYLQIFLAHAEYSVFIELMADKAAEQAAKA